MPTVVVPHHGTIQIPNWVKNLASFRTWVHSRVLPEKLAVHFLQGDVWVDFEREEAFTHNFVKAAVLMTLMQIAKADRSGVAFADGMLLTNDDAEMGTEPDAMYVSYKSFETKRVGSPLARPRERRPRNWSGHRICSSKSSVRAPRTRTPNGS